MKGHVKFRVQHSSHPLHCHEGFCQKQQVGVELDPVTGNYFNEIDKELSHFEFMQGEFIVFVDEFRQIPSQRSNVNAVCDVAGIYKKGDYLFNILFEDGKENIGEMSFQKGVNTAGHPEIEQADDIVRQNQDVARMRIAVEESVLQNHSYKSVSPPFCDEFQIETSFNQRVDLGDFDPRDELHGQKRFGSPLPVDLRKVQGLVASEARRKTLYRSPFQSQVHLSPDCSGKFSYLSGWIVYLTVGDVPLGDHGKEH